MSSWRALHPLLSSKVLEMGQLIIFRIGLPLLPIGTRTNRAPGNSKSYSLVCIDPVGILEIHIAVDEGH